MEYGFVDPCYIRTGLGAFAWLWRFAMLQVFAASRRKPNHHNDVMRCLTKEKSAIWRWGCELLPNTNQCRQSTLCPLKVMGLSTMWSLKTLPISFITPPFPGINACPPPNVHDCWQDIAPNWSLTSSLSSPLGSEYIVWFMGLIWKSSLKIFKVIN